MMSEKLILSFLFVGVGLLMIGISIPLALRRIGPNQLYGLRVPSTFADEKVWYDANARFARDMIIFGLVQVAAAIGAYPLEERMYAILLTVLVCLGTVGICLFGWVRANRMLARRQRS